MGWMVGVRILAGTRDFLISKTIQTISRAHPASYSMGTRVLSWGNGKYKATYDKLVHPCKGTEALYRLYGLQGE